MLPYYRLQMHSAVLFSVALLAFTAPVRADDESDAGMTEEGVINGTMEITFNTRTNLDTTGKYAEGSPALGAQDKYTINLTVAKTTQFTGEIVRQPNIYTKTLRKREQGAALGFDISLAVLNPRDLSQRKTVGKWVGLVPIDTETGYYNLAGGRKDDRPLRIAVDAVGKSSAFTDYFGGRLVGKAEVKDNLAEYTYKRIVGKKEVQITVKKSDPMRFDNIELAKGPAEIYPRTSVSGRLDYDYETGNWYTDGLRFRYSLNGVEHEDVVTGTIKWVEDPNRATNGKGDYEFNLRFNEEKHRTAGGESEMFDQMSDEDAFFAVDHSLPCLTGRISYVDSFLAGGGEEPLPSASKVTYALNANKLTKQQVMNFFKLWVLCIGPTNDE